MKRFLKHPFPWLAWTALVLVVLALHVHVELTGKRKTFFTSDMLTIESLYRDVAAGRDLGEWRLSGAPSFFPDMPVYFGLRAFIPNVAHAVLAFGIVFFALAACGWMAVWRDSPASRCDRRCGVPALGIAFGTLLYIAGHVHGSFLLLLNNTSHSGVLILLPWCLWLAWRVLVASSPKQAVFSALGLGLALAAGAMSDKLFILQVLLPCAAMAGWQLVRARGAHGRALLVLSTAAGAWFAGTWAGGLLNRYPVLDRYAAPGWPFGRPEVLEAFGAWWRDLWNVPVLQAFIVTACVFTCTYVLARGLWREIRRCPDADAAHAEAMAVFFLASAVINYAGLFAAGHRDAEVITRYMMPTFLLPMLWVWPVVLQALPKARAWLCSGASSSILSVAAIAVSAAALPMLSLGKALAAYADYYPPHIRCLDEELDRRGLTRGWGDYWMAKHVTCLSKRGLHVVQISRQLDVFFWVSNWAWYRLEPQFIIIDPTQKDVVTHRLDEQVIRKRFGEPAEAFDCPPVRVLVYNRPEDKAFRAIFSDLGEPKR